jgi:hypothetical protein
MLDDFLLGLKNVKNVFAKTKTKRESFLDHMDLGADATV